MAKSDNGISNAIIQIEMISDADVSIEYQQVDDEISEICRLAAELADPEPVSFTTT
jgi:hypothetical protein